ncbi:MAG: NADH-quinone oxidoreductase subunit C [Bacteroidales bacterium]|nr:NADH-quinone oxidoreductase subunit C [Bacteroidales bacterium]
MTAPSLLLRIKNGQSVDLKAIPVLNYDEFSDLAVLLLKEETCHCVSYYAFKQENGLKFIMAIADDSQHDVIIFSHHLLNGSQFELPSLTPHIFALHIFEREIHENFGVKFTNHPWLKPVRFSQNRFNNDLKINDYPFYSIKSDELHEVGVGPVHAGIIEPGHFRFICNGENVLHLEIQLGWQHRGIEQLFLDKKKMLQRNILAENIAGDTVIGHTSTFAQLMESLSDIEITEQIQIERALALELERIAIHTGDTAALCVDAAYYLGANVFGILRTGIINFTQSWCGNRLGKSLIRVGGTHSSFTEDLKQTLLNVLAAYEKMYIEMSHLTYRLPSVQNRFDNVGNISKNQAHLLGTVGLSARMSNVMRDIRISHPTWAYSSFPIETIMTLKGDVFARFLLKRKEIKRSVLWIHNLLDNYNFDSSKTKKPIYSKPLKPDSFAISLTEGWRGEICHCAVTDDKGELLHYKVKDPSMHNWKALEISLRDVEISDFPINNKSYNLSYCGHDL